MKNRSLTIALILVSITTMELLSQSRTILVFDLETNSVDSIIIDISTIDTSKQNDITSFFIGEYNSTIETLEQETPTENLIQPNAKSTKRIKAHLDYDLNSFPLRTSVKTSYLENDTMKNLCSGSMISKRHVLTAAHCHMIKDIDSLLVDSFVVCPVYDNGIPNLNFDCANVTKIYSFKNWHLDEDFVILELSENVGQQTGWLGIGYENKHIAIENEHFFYKFDYPARYKPNIDSTYFNGDTLFYRYGRAKVFTLNFGDSTAYRIGLQNNHAINGESGGSLISIMNNNKYVSYGVLSNGPHSFHSMITNESFHVFNQLIKDDINTTVEEPLVESKITVFPNPTTRFIQFDNVSKTKNTKMIITNVLGNKVLGRKNLLPNEQINLSHLPNGTYFVSFSIDDYTTVNKIVKLGG